MLKQIIFLSVFLCLLTHGGEAKQSLQSQMLKQQTRSQIATSALLSSGLLPLSTKYSINVNLLPLNITQLLGNLSCGTAPSPAPTPITVYTAIIMTNQLAFYAANFTNLTAAKTFFEFEADFFKNDSNYGGILTDGAKVLNSTSVYKGKTFELADNFARGVAYF